VKPVRSVRGNSGHIFLGFKKLLLIQNVFSDYHVNRRGKKNFQRPVLRERNVDESGDRLEHSPRYTEPNITRKNNWEKEFILKCAVYVQNYTADGGNTPEPVRNMFNLFYYTNK
jgi:hypothetical protein